MKTIGLILTDPRHPTPEEKAALAFLRGTFGGRAMTTLAFSAEAFAQAGRLLPRVLWWHYDRTAALPPGALDQSVIAAIRQHVKRGGGLLLSLLAAQYVADLGVESVRPNVITKGTWQEESWAQGYPDMRGVASRNGHPVFAALHGAAHTWSPQRGAPFAAAYYETPVFPKEGKIVAVEREYIRLNDRRRIVMEYALGRGRILTLGSHLFFTDPTIRFRPHRERLAINCIAYLGHSAAARGPRTYWASRPPGFEEVSRRGVAVKTKEREWTIEHSAPGIVRNRATGNAFDVGGRRILIMGEERRGIGEVWVHPVRILRDVAVTFQSGTGGHIAADALDGDVTIRSESLTRRRRVDDVLIEETVFGDQTLPAGGMHVEAHSGRTLTLSLSARIDLRTMWPLPARSGGTLRYGWDKGLRAFVVTDESASAVSIIGSDREPASTRVARNHGEHHELILLLDYTLEGPRADLTIVFAGSHTGEREALNAYRTMVSDPGQRLTLAARHARAVMEQATIIEGPDDEFNNGYRQAILSTQRFIATTPDLGTSLMAGYATTAHGWNGGQAVSGRPGYSWYFGRDSVWSSFALLGCGMFDAVKEVLTFLGGHQDITGKIMHEMTTSGHVHYDAADATPLYLILMGRYLRTSGDLAFVRTQLPRIRAALAFCFSTDTDGDHLIENTNVGHGWVEGGSLFPVHTELYLASCWLEALDQTAYVARTLRVSAIARRCSKEADLVKGIIRTQFWNPERRLYNFGKNVNGSFRTDETVLPAIAIYFGQTDPHRASETLDRFASQKFSADWGIRILPNDSPRYDPSGYHDGSIWPLFTGWVSLAEFASNRPCQGFVHAMNNLLLSRHWSAGHVPEVLHGERMDPAGVCAHQSWSDAMVLLPLLEGMLGFHADAPARSVSLRPYFPPDWRRAEVRNLHAGSATLSMTMRRRMNTTSFIFSTASRTPLTIVFRPWLPCGTTIHAVRLGAEVSLHAIHVRTPDDVPEIRFALAGELRVTFEHTGGVAVVPPVPRPEPGEDSSHLRVISERWNDGVYELALEGKGDRRYALDLFTEGRSQTTEKAWTVNVDDNRLVLALRFDDGGITSQYHRKHVRVPMEF